MKASDNELLRAYVRSRSESAFEELVSRHIQLVYSAALRQMNWDRSAADDVVQIVFTDLARKAPRLLQHTSLTGWLYTSTRYEAAKHRRAAQRRVNRETTAHLMNQIASNDLLDWGRVGPLLDDAMDELGSAERQMVLWRYFEGHPYAEIGRMAGLTENAARMRVERALDKVRVALAKREITSTSVALAAMLSAHAMESVPTGLAKRIARSSVAVGVGSGVAWLLVSSKAKFAAGVLGAAAILTVVLISPPQQSEPETNHNSALKRSTRSAEEPTVPAAENAFARTWEPANSDALVQFDPSAFHFTLTAASDSRPVTEGEVHCTIETPSGSESRRYSPDPEGVVLFHLPSNAVRLRLVTAFEGFADSRLEWRQDRGEKIPRRYELKLTPGVTLGGFVVNAENRPVADAEIQAHSAEPSTSPRPEAHVAGFTIKTDSAGRWRTCRVAPELVRHLLFSVRHSALGTTSWLRVGEDPMAEEQLRAGRHVFRLGALAAISGMVASPEGTPVSGATVRAGGLYEVDMRTARTDTNGWFEISGYKVGDVALTGEADGFAPTTITIALNENTPPVLLALQRGKPLSVRVLNPDGDPITGASVSVTPNVDLQIKAGRTTGQVFRQSQTTDSSGSTFFASLPEYPLWLGVWAPGFICQDGIPVEAGEPEVTVRLLRNLVVSGTVTDGVTGEPIPAFRIRTGKPEPDGFYFSDMDRFVLNFAGGTFTHMYDEGVTMGPNPGFVLRFESEGYKPVISRMIAPDDGRAELAIEMYPAKLQRVMVLNPDGSPARWTQVGVLDRTKGNSLALTPGGLEYHERTDNALLQTDDEGGLHLPEEAGIHRLVIANPQGYLETTLDSANNGEPIRLQPWARIDGQISSELLHTNSIVWIQLYPRPDISLMAGRSFHARPDAKGYFTLPRVPPNRLWLAVGRIGKADGYQEVWGSDRLIELELAPGEMRYVHLTQEDHSSK